MKRAFILIILMSNMAYAQLPVGTIRKSVVTDTNGWMINNPIGTSNQFSVITAATTANHVVRFGDFTNSVFNVTNSLVELRALTNSVNTGSGTGLVQQVSGRVTSIASLLPGTGITLGNSGNTNITINIVSPVTIATGGTGQSTTLLSGSWTNSINFVITGTNSANAYSVHGQLGFSGNVTNMVGSGLSNIVFYSDGIVTNRTVIP